MNGCCVPRGYDKLFGERTARGVVLRGLARDEPQVLDDRDVAVLEGGDRFASVLDPYGHQWQIATHVEDLSQEEMQRRSQEAMAAMTS